MAVHLKAYLNKKGQSIPYLSRDTKTEVFHAKKRIDGKICRRSLETTVESIAIAKLYQTLQEMAEEVRLSKLSAEERKREEATGNKDKLVRDFYVHMIEEKERKETRSGTLRRVGTIWRNNLEPYVGDLKPADMIAPDFLTEFMKWHRRARPGVQFMNTFKYLGNLYRIMAERGAIPLDKVPDLELPLTEARHHLAQKGRIISEDEYVSIYKHMTEEYRPYLAIAYYMGLRKAEIGELTGARVIQTKDHIYFDFKHENTKTGIERTPPVPDFLVKTVLRLKHQAGDGFLFPSPVNVAKAVTTKAVDSAWRRAKAGAEIKGRMRFHDLRHTRATAMVKANQNPLLIATYLGMTIVTLQKRYLHLDSKDLVSLNRTLVDLNERGDE